MIKYAFNHPLKKEKKVDGHKIITISDKLLEKFCLKKSAKMHRRSGFIISLCSCIGSKI